MAARNPLLDSPPFEVADALRSLGANLKIARLNRNLSIEEVAAKIGVHRHVVTAAERGKPSTGIGIYAGLLWAYGMAGRLKDIAAPESDEIGKALAMSRMPARAGKGSGALDNDF